MFPVLVRDRPLFVLSLLLLATSAALGVASRQDVATAADGLAGADAGETVLVEARLEPLTDAQWRLLAQSGLPARNHSAVAFDEPGTLVVATSHHPLPIGSRARIEGLVLGTFAGEAQLILVEARPASVSVLG